MYSPRNVISHCLNKTYLSQLLIVCFFFVFGIFSVQAETNVSSNITSNTTWSQDNAPYIVSNDIAITNRAVLNIEAGVTVYMQPQASITVNSGKILAKGTASAPILVTSINDNKVSNQAVKGDWKRWNFNAGSKDSSLSHIEFRYGSGLALQNTSLTLSNTVISDMKGAAITSDLDSSSYGYNNKANNNDINAVVLPSGDILNSVNWKMQGIPYYAGSGIISVGQSPAINSVSNPSLMIGETKNLVFNGTRLEGVTRVKSIPEGITVDKIVSTSTSISATLSVDGSVLPNDYTLLFYTSAGIVPFNNFKVLASIPIITSITPDIIYLNQGNVLLSINGSNFNDNSVVKINNNNLNTQYISNGNLQATINNLTTLSDILITVANSETLISKSFSIPVKRPTISLSSSASSVVIGDSLQVVATIPYTVWQDGGLNIEFSTSIPSVAKFVSSNIIIPKGKSSATATLNGLSKGNVKMFASSPDFAAGSTQVIVKTPPTLSISPASITIGENQQNQLVLQSSEVVSSESGLVVTLTSNNTDTLTVPNSVTVPNGSDKVAINLRTGSAGVANITATANGYLTANSEITVRPTTISIASNTLVSPTLTRTIPIMLSEPAPLGGLAISIDNSASDIVSAPTVVEIAEGESEANIMVNGLVPGKATLVLNATGYRTAKTNITVEAVVLKIGSPQVNSIKFRQGEKTVHPLYLSRPSPKGGLAVNVTSKDSSIFSLNRETIFIPEGQTSGGLDIIQLIAGNIGTTELILTSDGLNTTTIPVTVTEKGALQFTQPSVIVGKGLTGYIAEVSIARTVDGRHFNGSEALVVNLTSDDPSRVTVPTTVTIPAGQSTVYVPVSGINLTDDTPVAIRAMADGFESPSIALKATVKTPEFRINELETIRSPSGQRHSIYFSTYVTGARYTSNQTATKDITIDLAVTDASTAGIVTGFYDSQNAGNAITQTQLRKGETNSYNRRVWIGVPTQSGSYKVTATAAGITQTVTPEIVVSSPQLQFTQPSVIVGKGLTGYIAEVSIARTVDGRHFNGSEALVVSLNCLSTQICNVPANVTIPAGQSAVYVPVSGINTGDTILTASAAGHTSINEVAVKVIEPQIDFSNLSTSLKVGINASSKISLSVPGARYSGNQTATADLTIATVSTSTAILTVSESVVIKTNYTYSEQFYITGKSVGTAKIIASTSSNNVGESPLITVSP